MKTTMAVSMIILLAAAALTAMMAVGTADAQTGTLGYRAGVNVFKVGQAGIYVTLSKPMPDANYAAVVQPTNTAGYSPAKDCTYFNVLKKTTTNFQVQHKRCDDGTPVALDTNVSLNWVVWSYN